MYVTMHVPVPELDSWMLTLHCWLHVTAPHLAQPSREQPDLGPGNDGSRSRRHLPEGCLIMARSHMQHHSWAHSCFSRTRAVVAPACCQHAVGAGDSGP
jgi:hypothetical protein